MSVATDPKTIDLSNIGPVRHLSLPLLSGGGVVVLRGRNGAGKTRALKAIAATYDSSQRSGLERSDGVPEGSVAAPGMTIRVGKVNTKKGELEVDSIDAACDPSLLVDPGIKDPVAADAVRLKILVLLVTKEEYAERLGKAASETVNDAVMLLGYSLQQRSEEQARARQAERN